MFAVGIIFQDTTFEPSGKESIRTAYICNTSSKLLPVQISIKKWRLTDAGKDMTSIATSDFLIEPTQMLLRPNEKKIVTIRYVGPKELMREETYRFGAEEVPVDDGQKKGKLKVTMAHNTVQTIYVASPKFKPNLSIKSVSLVTKDVEKEVEGKVVNEKVQFFKVEIVNSGQLHYTNRGMKAILVPDKKSGERQLEIEMMRIPIILSDSTRTEYVPWPETMKKAQWTGTLKFSE